MRRRGRIGPWLCLALAFAVFGPAPGAWGAIRTMGLSLRTGGGYRVRVEARRATVSLSVSRAHRSLRTVATTGYVARGKVAGDEVRADFPGMGEISMRFKPSGRVRRGFLGLHCLGAEDVVTRFGVFTGRLRFRGEGGYVTIDSHRAKGKATTLPSTGCPLRPIGGPHVFSGVPIAKRGRVTFLGADFRQGIGAVDFFALDVGGQDPRYVAQTEQGGSGLATYRLAIATGPPSGFAADNALSFATIAPPPPFRGIGSLLRNPDGSRSWTGSLTASFPGDPDVPLTGPQFKTFFTRSF
jgi:hypothetical protein